MTPKGSSKTHSASVYLPGIRGDTKHTGEDAAKKWVEGAVDHWLTTLNGDTPK